MNLQNLTRREFGSRTAQLAGLTFFPANIITNRARPSEIIGHGNFRYRVHRDWGTLDAGITPVKNCHGMVQDARGCLLMIGDDTTNNILVYDTGGNLLTTWGREYPYGHGLTLWDAGGEEFLFICDNGASCKTMEPNIVRLMRGQAYSAGRSHNVNSNDTMAAAGINASTDTWC
ncbi:MAG: hypothetical protein OXI38_06255, partial [Bacteroidota bacterium]|nr:hypothetical protein [Bacteroidota bacterium]